MNFLYLFRVEFRRILKSKMFWAATALCVCSLLPGYFELPGFLASIQAEPTVMNSVYMANPILSGTFFGSLTWAAFAVYESDRVHRGGMDAITEAVVSPEKAASVKLLSLAALAALACVLCALCHFPYIASRLDYLFTPRLYVKSFLILPLPTWIISVTLASALYQITRRVEITAFIFAGLVLICFNEIFAGDYFIRWVNPIVKSYSDGFSSNYYLRIAVYTRMLWLLLSGGLWFFSSVCLRKYQNGFFSSFVRGLRKVGLPVTSVFLAALGALMWVYQPIVNHGAAEFNRSVYDDTREPSTAVITHTSHELRPDVFLGIYAGVTEFTVTKEKSGGAPEVIKLNSGYDIKSITVNGQPLAFSISDTDINDFRETMFEIPAGANQLLRIEYEGFPQELRCYSPGGWAQEINPESIELAGNSAAPAINCRRVDPVGYDLKLTIPGNLTPMVGGYLLSDFTVNPDGTKTWTASNERNFAELSAADYVTENFEAAGMNINLIYSRVYESMVAENGVREMMVETLEYCTSKYGQIDWMETGNDSDILMVQTKAASGAFPGRVELSEGMFNTMSYDGGYRGENASEIIAHETIHQWWGGSGSIMEFGHEYWSAEGLTVYTTYRMMKEKYGELYATQYYTDKWREIVEINNRNFYNRHPEIMHALPEIYQARINSGNLSINLYYRMPLMILKAEQLVGGEEKMDEILKELFTNHSGENFGTLMTYQNFLDACGLKTEDLVL